MKLAIIAALAKNNLIGNNGKIPWHDLTEWEEIRRADLARFKQLTLHHALIMGRKTHESLGKPLPERTNIVLTRNYNFPAGDNIIIAHSRHGATQKAFEIAPNGTAFVIGGAQIYKIFLPYATSMYITRINGEFKGDAYFPEISNEDWVLKNKSLRDFGTYSFTEYIRKI